jgi:hypothetical protein
MSTEEQLMRKIRLTPIAREVLWILEEAGEENLSCVLATLKCTQDELTRAVAALKRLGFVADSFGAEPPSIYMTDLGRLALTR